MSYSVNLKNILVFYGNEMLVILDCPGFVNYNLTKAIDSCASEYKII